MVWSDNTQFPFIVIDNNGNTIVIIDENGLHIPSHQATSGDIDITSDPITGAAIIRFWNSSHTKYSIINGKDLSGPTDYPIIGISPYNPAAADYVGGSLYSDATDFGGVLRDSGSVPQFAIFGNATFSGGGIFFFDHTATAPNQSVQWNKATGYLQCGDNTWYTITKQNGWVNRTGWRPLAYQFQPDGMIRLRGCCQSGNGNSGTVIGNIGDPRAIPKLNDRMFPLATDDANGYGVGTPRLQLEKATGNLVIYDVGFGPLYFDGITWDVT